MHSPAFVHSASPLSSSSITHQILAVCPSRPGSTPIASSNIRMSTPGDRPGGFPGGSPGGSPIGPGGFFESEVVRNEAMMIAKEQTMMMELGKRYGKFDREGKLVYLDKMEELMDRVKIFHKRLELSDDFAAKMNYRELQNKFSAMGTSESEAFEQMKRMYTQMRQEVLRE